MNDLELLRMFVAREADWVSRLARLQVVHRKQFRRTIGPVHWMSGDTLGSHSWLGFYWKPEYFWFGYGLHDGAWKLLIEADRRSAASVAWEVLREDLPETWPLETSPRYFRLWGPAADAGGEDQDRWLLSRSRELHEFAVVES